MRRHRRFSVTGAVPRAESPSLSLDMTNAADRTHRPHGHTGAGKPCGRSRPRGVPSKGRGAACSRRRGDSREQGRLLDDLLGGNREHLSCMPLDMTAMMRRAGRAIRYRSRGRATDEAGGDGVELEHVACRRLRAIRAVDDACNAREEAHVDVAPEGDLLDCVLTRQGGGGLATDRIRRGRASSEEARFEDEHEDRQRISDGPGQNRWKRRRTT